VLWHAVVFERYLRTHPRYRELQPLADAVGRIPSGARIGILSGAFFPENLFFSDGYRHVVLPLSYDSPRTREALERLRLHPLWVETVGGCGTVVFRRDFTAPPPAADRSRRPSADYDL